MPSRRATPDQIIAHVDWLRAVDRLLEQADVVKKKREKMNQLLKDAPGRDHDGQGGGPK
jgi:hypothetical protein